MEAVYSKLERGPLVKFYLEPKRKHLAVMGSYISTVILSFVFGFWVKNIYEFLSK